MVLVMGLHLPLGPVQDLRLSLPEIPLRQLSLTHEPIGGVHIDLGEEHHQPAGDIEPLLVVEVVLGVHVLFPLRLRLLPGGRRKLRVGVLDVLLLPLLVLAAALDVGDERVEGYRRVVEGRGEGEVGAELEAAVAMVGRGFPRGPRHEEEHHHRYGYVDHQRPFAHFLLAWGFARDSGREREISLSTKHPIWKERERDGDGEKGF